MSYAIAGAQVAEFVDSIFAEDLHAKRVLSLANATTGVLRSAALGIHAIGRGLAQSRGTSAKHSVKQVDRLLSNDGLDVWALFPNWIKFVLADRTDAQIALDWTEFDKDAHSTLVASLVSSHGRTTPLAWLSVTRDELVGQRLETEDKLLEHLKNALPSAVTRVVIIADRGFADAGRWNSIRRFGFDFIIRIRGDILVTNADGKTQPAIDWVSPTGMARTFKGVAVTGAQTPIATFVTVRERDMKDAWCLVSSIEDTKGPDIVKAYGRRFTIEESFRDIKDLRFGMGLKSTRISSPKRRDRLLLISALAIALLTLLGAAGEAAKIDRHFKTNTSKKRQLSLFRQGCEYYEFLPTMRDEWAEPLLSEFAKLLEAHETFAETLGVI